MIEEVGVNRWQDFRDFVDGHRSVVPVYWRGQPRPDQPLASSFEREILSMLGGWRKDASQIYPYDGRYVRDGGPLWARGFYQAMRDRYLEEFKLAASGLRGPSPAKLNRDEWWALGKHYGLVSPLLDWSEGPYVAAFFALADLHQRMAQDTPGELVFTGERAAVYRLVHDERLEDDHLRVVRPIVEELGRMHGQRGLFTWLDSEEFFELEGYLESVGKIGRLTRVVISDQAVLDGLRDLEAHGITYRALFPDLVGAAQYANAKFTLGF